MHKQPGRLQASVRKVLGGLSIEALLCLKDKRLEVRVVPSRWTGIAYNPVWAYFPILPLMEPPSAGTCSLWGRTQPSRSRRSAHRRWQS